MARTAYRERCTRCSWQRRRPPFIFVYYLLFYWWCCILHFHIGICYCYCKNRFSESRTLAVHKAINNGSNNNMYDFFFSLLILKRLLLLIVMWPMETDLLLRNRICSPLVECRPKISSCSIWMEIRTGGMMRCAFSWSAFVVSTQLCAELYIVSRNCFQRQYSFQLLLFFFASLSYNMQNELKMQINRLLGAAYTLYERLSVVSQRCAMKLIFNVTTQWKYIWKTKQWKKRNEKFQRNEQWPFEASSWSLWFLFLGPAIIKIQQTLQL